MDILLQEKKIAYRAVEVKDAVKMLSIMDLLKEALDKTKDNCKEGEAEKFVISIETVNGVIMNPVSIGLERRNLKAVYDTLIMMGFCTSVQLNQKG